MKIVRIIARLNVGGPARHVTWLTAGMQDDGFESVLVAGTVPEGESDMGYFAAEHDVEPVFIREMSRELSLRDIVSFYKVLRLLLRERPDIIHTHTAKAGTVGRAAALVYRLFARKRVSVVHTYHGHVFHSYYGKALTFFFLSIERVLAKIATDRLIVISEQQRKEISETFGVGTPRQFEVIGLGIDAERLRPPADRRGALRAEIGAVDGDFVFGFVGRLTEIKNLPMLIEAAAIVRDTGRSARMRFVVAGDGHLREALVAKVRDLGLDDAFIFIGHRTDVAELYAGLDAVVLTSLNEGTPLSLIESMAAGKTFVSTSVGGVNDLAGEETESHGGVSVRERGLTVQSGDAASLAEALVRLAADDPLRERLARSGEEFVRRRYGKDRLIGDVKNLYRGLVHTRS